MRDEDKRENVRTIELNPKDASLLGLMADLVRNASTSPAKDLFREAASQLSQGLAEQVGSAIETLANERTSSTLRPARDQGSISAPEPVRIARRIIDARKKRAAG